jgi:hypothetical protein
LNLAGHLDLAHLDLAGHLDLTRHSGQFRDQKSLDLNEKSLEKQIMRFSRIKF